jgi:hypothetical protein
MKTNDEQLMKSGRVWFWITFVAFVGTVLAFAMF